MMIIIKKQVHLVIQYGMKLTLQSVKSTVRNMLPLYLLLNPFHAQKQIKVTELLFSHAQAKHIELQRADKTRKTFDKKLQ